MTITCDRRQPGEQFCDVCPFKARRVACPDKDHENLKLRSPSSFASRLGVFILSAMALTILPGVVRNVVRLKIEGDISSDLISILGMIAAGAGSIMIALALYGLYFAVFGRDKSV